jgi:hypothetical protein
MYLGLNSNTESCGKPLVISALKKRYVRFGINQRP